MVNKTRNILLLTYVYCFVRERVAYGFYSSIWHMAYGFYLSVSACLHFLFLNSQFSISGVRVVCC